MGDKDIFNVFAVCYFLPLIFRKGKGNIVPRGKLSNGISLYFLPLDVLWVWCLMIRCIYYGCSITIRLAKYLKYLLLPSISVCCIFRFKQSSWIVRDLFYFFKVITGLVIFCLWVSYFVFYMLRYVWDICCRFDEVDKLVVVVWKHVKILFLIRTWWVSK